MAGINLIKNLKALNSVRVPLETVPTNGQCKFDSKNNDLKNSFGKGSGNNKNNNNEQKYNGNNDYNNGDKNIVITIIKSFLIIIVMIESYD